MLRVGGTTVGGRMSDTRGEFWQFHAADLKPGRPYSLALVGNRGRALCEPWSLATFPAPEEKPQSFRVLFYTCAGGHEAFGFLPPAIRNRLLRRALSFQPSAMVAIGDQVYWDLLAPENAPKMGASPAAERIAGKFDRSALVLGSDNETVLKRAVEPQLIPVYVTDFRSTPVFFMQDDHDYFDNDEATDEVITFPPPYFSLQLARATQSPFYPEFLPDRARPLGLPWSAAGDRFGGVSETFGTVRYGRLAEILLYDIRRTQTLAGPSAVYLDLEVEKWLKARTAAREVTHVVHVPSNPPGWTAGKWGEWYPDVLGSDGKLTTAKPKPYWQPGWLKQHDRLMESIAAVRETRAAGDERRPACPRHWPHDAQRQARFLGQSDQCRVDRSNQHAAKRLAVGAQGHRRAAARPSRHGRRRQADRAARLHHRGFYPRQARAADVQVRCEDAKRRGDRHPRSVPYGGTDAASVKRAPDRLEPGRAALNQSSAKGAAYSSSFMREKS